ncbi:MAG TPA: hypothetical protein VGO69_02865 [Pyrinomonadaceae bacterium]|jgi:hypothetical protein|nr:hypothetical protein [Pyrinomonadaceae bacterium]
MRRYVQILGLVMLAFAASGWSSIVAVALCPHANSNATKTVAAVNVADAHACHPVQAETVAKPHCHEDSAMEQEATAGIEMPRAMPGNKGSSVALTLPENVPCTHCMGRPELPASTVVARPQVEQKRSIEPAVQAASLVMSTLSFTQPVIYRQGAPPGSLTPKHLLIGVLLI